MIEEETAVNLENIDAIFITDNQYEEWELKKHDPKFLLYESKVVMRGINRAFYEGYGDGSIWVIFQGTRKECKKELKIVLARIEDDSNFFGQTTIIGDKKVWRKREGTALSREAYKKHQQEKNNVF